MNGRQQDANPPAKPRRVSQWRVRPAAAGYTVFGDDQPLRTPAGHDLVVPSEALAEAIAAELRTQLAANAPRSKAPDITAMPNLRLAATALDRVAVAREDTLDMVAAYGETELLCYRADCPADLAARQQAAWQPLLDWAALRFDAPLCVTAGVMPQPQPSAALAALRAAVAAYDDLMLTALAFAVQTSGSLVLGLALAEGRLGPEEAFALAELDETYQIEQWGEDAEATLRRATRRQDLQEAASFIALCRPARRPDSPTVHEEQR